MAELEIHTEHEHKSDPTGQKVGVLAALLAVALAIVTISSHRTHTAAIMHKSSANDAWAHYQATRVKYHNLELGQSLVKIFGDKSGPAIDMLTDSAKEMSRYDDQAKKIQADAEGNDREADVDENRALRYDLGEGLLEIGLVVSSMYFISRKGMFPVMGIVAGILGVVIAASGLLV
jgi:Domain of unknown function (DUF4337)